MKIYSIAYRYQGRAWCALISLDKDALNREVAKQLDSDSDYEKKPIVVKESKSLLFQDNTPTSPYSTFIRGNAVLIGSRHTDARCTGMKNFYTHPDHVEAAKKAFLKDQEAQQIASDNYYQQSWI